MKQGALVTPRLVARVGGLAAWELLFATFLAALQYLTWVHSGRHLIVLKAARAVLHPLALAGGVAHVAPAYSYGNYLLKWSALAFVVHSARQAVMYVGVWLGLRIGEATCEQMGLPVCAADVLLRKHTPELGVEIAGELLCATVLTFVVLLLWEPQEHAEGPLRRVWERLGVVAPVSRAPARRASLRPRAWLRELSSQFREQARRVRGACAPRATWRAYETLDLEIEGNLCGPSDGEDMERGPLRVAPLGPLGGGGAVSTGSTPGREGSFGAGGTSAREGSFGAGGTPARAASFGAGGPTTWGEDTCTPGTRTPGLGALNHSQLNYVGTSNRHYAARAAQEGRALAASRVALATALGYLLYDATGAPGNPSLLWAATRGGLAARARAWAPSYVATSAGGALAAALWVALVARRSPRLVRLSDVADHLARPAPGIPRHFAEDVPEPDLCSGPVSPAPVQGLVAPRASSTGVARGVTPMVHMLGESSPTGSPPARGEYDSDSDSSVDLARKKTTHARWRRHKPDDSDEDSTQHPSLGGKVDE